MRKFFVLAGFRVRGTRWWLCFLSENFFRTPKNRECPWKIKKL